MQQVQSTNVLRVLCRPLTARDYGASAGSSAAANGRSAPSSAAKGRVLTAAQGNILCRVCLSRIPWLPGHKYRKTCCDLSLQHRTQKMPSSLKHGTWVLSYVYDPARHALIVMHAGCLSFVRAASSHHRCCRRGERSREAVR